MTKRKGAIIPDPVDPPGTRRVVVCVPDTVEWLSLFTGCVAQMTFGWYWDRSTGDLDAVRNRAKQMYFEMQEQNGLCDVIDCEEVADCIETSEAVQNAINSLIQTQIDNAMGNPLSAAAKSTPLNQNPDLCDENELWGACANTIITLNRLNLDFLEQVEAATNNQEAVSLLFGAIPFLETLPVDEAISAVDQIRSFVLEFYMAGYDVDLEYEFQCELFCLALANDCVLDMDLITEYFWQRAEVIEGWEDAFSAAETILSAMANWQETTGEAIVTCMFAANVGFLTYLNSALGMDFGRFRLQTKAGIPDDDWMNCECSDTWLHEWDFTVEDGGWVANTVGGFNASWASGEGWYRDSVAGNPALRIWKAYTGLLTGEYIKIEVDIQAPAVGSTTHQYGAQSMDEDGSPSVNMVVRNDLHTGENLFVDFVTGSPVNGGIGIYLNNFIVANGQRYAITRVKLAGTGADPFA